MCAHVKHIKQKILMKQFVNKTNSDKLIHETYFVNTSWVFYHLYDSKLTIEM